MANVSTCAQYLNLTQQCAYFWERGATLESNADIAGLGAVIAFLISSWTALILLLLAYFAGILPQNNMHAIDNELFRANKAKVSKKFQPVVLKVLLSLSDQQLFAGIGILVAGFVELPHGLSVYHWQFVTGMAWLSSTVHLVTINVFREDFNKYVKWRCFRLAGMTVLFVLLVIALIPSTARSFFVATWDDTRWKSASNEAFLDRRATPVKCFWSRGAGFPLKEGDEGPNWDSIATYINLLALYLWTLCRLFHSTGVTLRTQLRKRPEAFLDRLAQQSLKSIVYRSIAFSYFCLMMWTETVFSFIFTILLLLVTLVWGTLSLLVPRASAPGPVRKEEAVITFGGVLSLLLLLQTFIVVSDHYADHESSASNSSTFCTEKADEHRIELIVLGQSDGVYSSNSDYASVRREFFKTRTFRVLATTLLLWFIAQWSSFAVMAFFGNNDGTLRLLAVGGLFATILFISPLWMGLCLRFSKVKICAPRL